MSERETQIPNDLQLWKGVDQRTQPTLVENGFFVMSRGVFFGFGENAERLPGKLLSGKLDEAIFSITQFGKFAMVQTLNNLFMVDIEDLINRDIVIIDGIQDENGDFIRDQNNQIIEE